MPFGSGGLSTCPDDAPRHLHALVVMLFRRALCLWGKGQEDKVARDFSQTWFTHYNSKMPTVCSLFV
jgi:hypothetical protein